MPDANEPDEDALRLLTIWGAGQGLFTVTAQEGMPAGEQVRELGQYLGEALFDLADTGKAVAGSNDRRQRMSLLHGVTTEWFTTMRTRPTKEVLQTLAFLAEILHAAIEGAVASGCYLDDVHQYVAKLQDSLASAAGDSGIVDELRQMLAEAPRPEQ